MPAVLYSWYNWIYAVRCTWKRRARWLLPPSNQRSLLRFFYDYDFYFYFYFFFLVSLIHLIRNFDWVYVIRYFSPRCETVAHHRKGRARGLIYHRKSSICELRVLGNGIRVRRFLFFIFLKNHRIRTWDRDQQTWHHISFFSFEISTEKSQCRLINQDSNFV